MSEPDYTPTRKEIERICREIQDTWTEAERERRAGLRRKPVEVEQYREPEGEE